MKIDPEDIERRADFIVRELDELCALAADPATLPMIRSEQITLSQIQMRVQLILSYLAVKNGETIQRNHGLHVGAQDRQRRDLGSSR
jgi:hypothetical protein